MSDTHLILHPAEQDFAEFWDKQEEIWQATKRAIRDQRDIMERAQRTIQRLERQLDALGEARIVFKEFGSKVIFDEFK